MNKDEDLLKKINENSTYREIKDELLTMVDMYDELNDIKMKCEGFLNISYFEKYLSYIAIDISIFSTFVNLIVSLITKEFPFIIIVVIVIIFAVVCVFIIVIMNKEFNKHVNKKTIITNILYVINTIENNPEIICDKCKSLYYCSNGLHSLTQKRKCKCNDKYVVKKH